MKKIKYNLAKNKRVDMFRFTSVFFLLLACSGFFIVFGVQRIVDYRKTFKSEIAQVNEYKNKLDRLSAMVEQYRRDIKDLKSRWKNRVTFANLLIYYKNFSYTEKLTLLEELLPEGVYISQISFDTKNREVINLTFVSDSYNKMVTAWSSLKPHYHFTISSERETDNYFMASLRITRKNAQN